jgi:hypothetical protein
MQNLYAYICLYCEGITETFDDDKNDNNNATNEDLGMNQITGILAFFGLNNRIPAQIIRMRK